VSEARFMNGQTQSGGHWNVAFRMMARASGGLGSPKWSSRSGDGSATGNLFITRAHKSVAQRSIWLRHEEEQTDEGGNRINLLPHPFLHVSRQLIDCIALTHKMSVQECTVITTILASCMVSLAVPITVSIAQELTSLGTSVGHDRGVRC
jgi:hypothetical protein